MRGRRVILDNQALKSGLLTERATVALVGENGELCEMLSSFYYFGDNFTLLSVYF